MGVEIKLIDGKWTAILGEVKITGKDKESLQSLLDSFRDDIPNCSYCDYTPCRCSQIEKQKKLVERPNKKVLINKKNDK